MCLIYLAHRVHPRYPLVVAANRDEFHDRASLAAHWWEDHPRVLAGRDLEAGGTWMGVNRGGRFAAVTNFRDARPRDTTACSRGELVSDFLTCEKDAMSYLGQVAARSNCYNGFSLLVHDGQVLGCYSNRGGDPEQVSPGVHGLSNGLLDSPWPKVEEGKLDLLGLMSRDAVSAQHLLGLLDHRTPAVDTVLPDSGVGLERERQLSPRFILDDQYGTRCSSTVVVSVHGEIEFRERRFDRNGEPRGDTVVEFRIDAGPGAPA